ncbi:MAG: Activator of Hsp90 ATPase 1 family protein [Bryobacterales bacterium]|nr:Activator of Hsp90 ATPase 1 family protein [Bryobacterales bacterium]
MSALETQEAVQTLEVAREQLIAAPIEVVFETILEQMGPLNETPDGTPLPMRLEAWPGGRWFRDLGNNTGHLWGHVQAVKPPSLVEIYGPLFMSTPAISNVQYRLTAEGNSTRLKFCHRAVGWILPEHRDSSKIGSGWGSLLARVKARAEQKQKQETLA